MEGSGVDVSLFKREESEERGWPSRDRHRGKAILTGRVAPLSGFLGRQLLRGGMRTRFAHSPPVMAMDEEKE